MENSFGSLISSLWFPNSSSSPPSASRFAHGNDSLAFLAARPAFVDLSIWDLVRAFLLTLADSRNKLLPRASPARSAKMTAKQRTAMIPVATLKHSVNELVE